MSRSGLEQKSLSLEKQRFETLAGQAPFGLVMIGKKGLFQYVNEKFKQMFGYNSKEMPDGEEWLKKAFPDSASREEVLESMEENGDIARRDRVPRFSG